MPMKQALIAAIGAAAFVLAAAPACAQEDLAKKYKCTGCHQVDTDKTAPPASFKVIAGKYKGKDGAADQLVGKLTNGHHGQKPSADDAKSIVNWILGMA